MITRAFSVCFEGIEPQLVEIECAISPGLPAFSVIGLPDKAVSEARDRIRSALGALSIALPSRRITINLSPADMPKEGSHLGLPIALALLAALNIITYEDSEGALAIGELSLDGRLQPVVGALPPLNAMEALETSMIQSAAGFLGSDGIQSTRPFRERHHTASMAAIVGGGKGAKPGEISLAHNGILFLDELPEFPRHVLETLRQPLETGEVMISRANAHVKYPCKFSLIAAANPCKCGFMTDPDQACGRAPNCGNDYLGRISGPLMDRFDLRIEVPVVRFQDLSLPASGERSHVIAKRVLEARALQDTRFSKTEIATNSDLTGDAMDRLIKMDEDATTYLEQAAIKLNLTARGFHRVIRVSRTIADLEQSENVARHHVGEAISFRNSANAA
jgi:predicted ATPase with chaperone activity